MDVKEGQGFLIPRVRSGDGLVQSTSTNQALCPHLLCYGVHIPLPTHPESRAQEASWLFCQILEFTKSKVRDELASSHRTVELQLPKCVCSQSTVFMKLSDSTSTSDSAWVLLG